MEARTIVDKLRVLSPMEGTYSLPQSDFEMRLFVQDESGSNFYQTIMIQTVIPDWGPKGTIRVEGYVNQGHSKRRVIGFYRIERREENLGSLEVQDA
jgi:hypothetical protein